MANPPPNPLPNPMPHLDRLVYGIYRFVLIPFLKLLVPFVKKLAPSKLRETLQDKDEGFTQLHSLMTIEEIARLRPIWIHAASGEIEYARPLIRELKKKYPETPLLVTYSSPSAKKILGGLDEVDAWAALPWESAAAITDFIEKWKPRVLLFARTDVWPVLADTCHQLGLPSLLFAATFAQNSSRLRGLSLCLNRYALNRLDKILCVDEADRDILTKKQIHTQVSVTGDTRFDQVFYRLAHPKPLKSNLIPSPEEFVFICGSTWPEDEEILLPALPALLQKGVKVLIAPHEMGGPHLQHLTRQLSQMKVPYRLYSQTQEWANEVLIVDQVGILAELYTWGDIAFVGGSFKKQVHSVMEPLAAGLPVLVGPFHHNNREALYFKAQHYSSGLVVQQVESFRDIETLVLRAFQHAASSHMLKEEIRHQVFKKQQATQLTLSEVEGLAILDSQLIKPY